MYRYLESPLHDYTHRNHDMQNLKMCTPSWTRWNMNEATQLTSDDLTRYQVDRQRL